MNACETASSLALESIFFVIWERTLGQQ